MYRKKDKSSKCAKERTQENQIDLYYLLFLLGTYHYFQLVFLLKALHNAKHWENLQFIYTLFVPPYLVVQS